MNAALIFTIIEKGLTLIPQLISAGATVMPLIQRLTSVTKGGAAGTVTAEELAALEADLDAALNEFNSPMPPA